MDLKFALRSMRVTPGLTLLAVVVMALGIGANTAVFSVVNTVLLKPLDYRDADRIVTIRNFWTRSGSVSENISAPDFHDWHDQSTLFQAMAYYDSVPEAVIAGSTAEYAQVSEVSPEFFEVFGIQPLAGGTFSADEIKPHSGGAAILSDAYWHSRFGANPDAIGKTLRAEGKDLTIVGVMPPGFGFPSDTSIWYPANTISPENNHRSGHNYRAVGLLKPGASLQAAQAQMSAIASRLEQLYPPSNTGKNVRIERMQDSMVSSVRLTLYVLLGAVGLVLLIACANVANLLLAKATRRTREIAIRAAVGASRMRIVRQLIVESLTLAIFAGALGLVIATWGIEAIKLLAPGDVPRLAETSADLPVLMFTFVASVISAVLSGLMPALAASKVDLNEALKRGAKGVGGGSSGPLRSSLVVAEIAIAAVLLTGAGLLMRSFDALINVDLGFRPEKILVAQTSVQVSSHQDAVTRAVAFDRDMLPAIAAIPGVVSAGGSFALPGDPGSNGGYWIDHMPPIEQLNVTAPQAVFTVIAPGTFGTLGIPLVSGRDFNDRDAPDAPYSVIINQALARKSFAGENPIGRVLFCGFDYDSMRGMTIVGIAADVREYGPATPPGPEIFMPYTQHPFAASHFMLLARTASDPAALSSEVRRRIQERDPQVPVKFTTVEASLAEGVAAPRFRMILFGLFAALAVALAMAGVYGVMSYAVSQRSSEIGLRMALGADSRHVLRMVLGQGLLLVMIGLAVGLAGSFAVTGLLASLLFEVKPADPLTYAAVAGILTLVVLAACYVPALRATRVDPVIALREE
ncbi:MAG TPA: ABC transporter permease [Bryobacteraceae bacterium]|nr:ABC transporter permease [Bryobacteraceae bacterium]